jgi:hypothetical protein
VGSFLSAPPREQVWVVSSVYGSLSGPAWSSTRTRLWILLESGDLARPFARICRNDAKTGLPYYTDLGAVRSARHASKRLEMTMVDDLVWTLTEAPCVCGAGAAGMAGPVEGRYDLTQVRSDQLEWFERL